MNVPTPASSAAPLHLYDYTHGQRRLAVWQANDRHGRAAVYAALCVPVILQAPGEAPETTWVEVATGRAYAPVVRYYLAERWAAPPLESYRLELGHTTFALYHDEAEAIAEYLGVDMTPLDGQDAA